MRTGLAMWTALVLLVSCGNNPSEKVTREDCSKVADRLASVIADHWMAHPDELWDLTHRSPDQPSDLPPTVTKETFKDYLATPEGKTWSMQALGWARTGTEDGIEPCMQHATPKQVKCFLAAKTKDDVTACDKAK
jgi:hypothetical protein